MQYNGNCKKVNQMGNKFLRYLALNIFIWGILDLFLFDLMQRAIQRLFERERGAGEGEDWVGKMTVDTGGQTAGGVGRESIRRNGPGVWQV